MRCLDDDAIFDFMNGALGDEQQHELDRHIKDCADCRSVIGEAAKASFGHSSDGDEATIVSSEEAFSPGVYIGRCELRHVIGRGGMGIVYAAYDSGLHRMVALKVMRGDMPQARLLREARTMARVSHPNVVSIYDVGVFAGRVFLTMEYVDGVTLDRWVHEEERPWTEVLRVLIAAAHGLQAAHACGVVHGDFKPANVLVGRDGRVRVTDFGLARWQHGFGDERTLLADEQPQVEPADSTQATRVVPDGARVAGTLSYLAPEQLRGRQAAEKSDQFAFCVALYECLYGRHPFLADRPSEMLQRVRRGEHHSPPENSPVPRYLFQVLRRGLRVRPGERFATLEELIRALTLSEATWVSPHHRRWLGIAGRALALTAAGLLLGGGLAALRVRLAKEPLPTPAAITRSDVAVGEAPSKRPEK